MSTSITFVVWGPQNTLRVRFFKRACGERNSSCSHSTPVGKCTNQTHFFFYPRIAPRPHVATAEYGGTFSFCRCVHSVGGITGRDGRVFSKICDFIYYLILCLDRIDLYCFYLYALIDGQGPKKDTKPIGYRCTLEMLGFTLVQLAVKVYLEVLVWDLKGHIKPVADLPDVHLTINDLQLNCWEPPSL